MPVQGEKKSVTGLWKIGGEKLFLCRKRMNIDIESSRNNYSPKRRGKEHGNIFD
jgi:hypothetical protein